MPTYSYLCEACKHTLEASQKISEEPLKKCPKCGKSKLKRQISSVRVIFKGTGWTPKGNKYGY